MNRYELLKRELDLTRPGLEIGALHNPCVRRSESNVHYVDHLPTDALKEKYREQGLPEWRQILDVDVVVGPQGLAAAVGDRSFGYVVASHVIEHVANPIAWLRDIHALLEPGGVLALAIPDRRFCFDALRAETPTRDWIDAYVRGESMPSPGEIFDALHNESTYEGRDLWTGAVDAGALKHRTHPRAAYLAAVETFRSGEYRDVHCSVFTPASFFGIVRQLMVLELFDFEVASFTDTIDHEFLVHLRKPAQADWVAQIGSVPLFRHARFAALPAQFDPLHYLRVNPDVAAARLDPAEHYLNYGRLENRSCSAATLLRA